ncbi:membrane integrity-associated transporter subunit PqiC [Paraburkholderia sp. EG285A]|uniref:membrane integrity-associated transporter subunit PqiC n=1 Tax=Paraburkholderia sp. EG285A TaxID=3237009 RepID=UPI0034D22CDB
MRLKTIMRSRQAGCLKLLTALCSIATLAAACTSIPEAQTYTLGTGSSWPVSRKNASVDESARPAFLIDVAPVVVPAQVARRQLVLQKDSVRVQVMEQERWSTAPADEIRQSLSASLSAALGTFEVANVPFPADQPVYRVSVVVQRFESWYASHALLDAVWTVRPRTGATMLTCHSTYSVPVGNGFGELVKGHQQAVSQLSDEIAAAILAVQQESPAPSKCVRGAMRTAATGIQAK